MQIENQVILVDEFDREIGKMEKLEAHRRGLLHRAFSVFIFNSQGQMLLQKRAMSKYHSPGLWTNACCSHPAPGEALQETVERRLREELGMYCNTQKSFDFIYYAELEKGLIEHELDHVFIGNYDELPIPNLEEAEEVKFFDLLPLEEEIKKHPYRFTVWFRLIFPRLKDIITTPKAA
jgi:isopentenyl-diphosphate delta-isomerase